MSRTYLYSFICLFSLSPAFISAQEATEEPVAAKHASAYRHVVLFKFKDTASKEQVAEVVEAFKALPAKIPEIVGFEWGTQCSPEGLTAGMTHCFLITFKSKAGLEVYLPHPEHKKFVDLVLPVLDGKPIVADFVATDVYSKKISSASKAE